MDPEERQALMDALLDAFDQSSLEQMLSFKMDVRLDEIVPPTHMRGTVFGLIRWAEQVGRKEELETAAISTRPNNPKLAALRRTSGAAAPEPAARPGLRAQPPYFQHPEILRLHGLLIQAGMGTHDHLGALKGAMDLDFRASLPDGDTPSVRLLDTLVVLNQTSELAGGETPFETLLAHAV